MPKAKTKKGLIGAKAAAAAAVSPRVARANELLDLIARRVARIVEDFYDVGVALNELKEKKLFVVLGYATFDALIEARSPVKRSQAYKLMAVADKLKRSEALALGEEKAYAVARLVAATPEADSVASIVEKGIRLGKSTRRAESMSAREIDAVTRSVVRRTRPRDDLERDAEASARDAAARLRKSGIRVTIEVIKSKGAWWAKVRVPIEQLGALAGAARER